VHTVSTTQDTLTDCKPVVKAHYHCTCVLFEQMCTDSPSRFVDVLLLYLKVVEEAFMHDL
jgi:hypothetical protein